MNMQLNDRENSVYQALTILTLTCNGQPLTWSKLVEHAHILGRMVNMSEEEINNVINFYENNNGVSKIDSKVIHGENNSFFSVNLEHLEMPHLNRYLTYLRADKKFPLDVIASLKKDLLRTCAYFADPSSAFVTYKKGLVVGDVQSGKTANYIGLINLAVDIGYKNIVLLTGTTENLRNQTQKRIDDGFIGAKSKTIARQIEYTGVGKLENKYFAITFTDEDKDFLKHVLDSIKSNESDYNKPRIFVIKKNKKVLNELKEYLSLNEGTRSPSSLLIIDDECDYASLNTKTNDDRTAINGLIGELFKLFKVTTYVGYTATPYANVFVDPDDNPNSIDLFPSDFIVLLEPPSNYIGGLKIFKKWPKKSEENHEPIKQSYGPHLYLLSENEKNFLPTIHKIDDTIAELPDSLKLAICTFLVANCIRTLKGDGLEHRSMLINISRFNNVQESIKVFVVNFVKEIKDVIEQSYMRTDLNRFLNSDITKLLYSIWSTDVVYHFSCGEVKDKNIPPLRQRFKWEQIQPLLYEEIQKMEVTVANNKHKNDRYNYEEKKEQGARVIVIGGFSLSRGLTLEGLMVSYYNRNASAYDVLLQMGRWFGYRKYYDELCMIFMSQINIDCFNAAIGATEELKESFRQMADEGKKPSEFGLAVRQAPETLETSLLVTARNKCKNSSPYKRIVNLGGSVIDTSKIYKSEEINNSNKNAVEKLLEEARYEGKVFEVSDSDSSYKMLNGLDYEIICKFIARVKFPLTNKSFDKDGIIQLIKKQTSLHKWDVVFAKGNRKDSIPYSFQGINGMTVSRSFLSRKSESFIRIADTNNRLADPNLFRIGLSSGQLKALRDSGPEKDTFQAKEYLKFQRNPLLIIYPITLKAFENEKTDNHERHELDSFEIEEKYKNKTMIGIALGFPGKAGDKVEAIYLYNKVKIDEILAEEGDEDIDDDLFKEDN